MKRFTDTEKWSDPWFRKLSPVMKCFWNFICDRCDACGVWKPDFEVASFFVGEKVSREEAEIALAGRVKETRSGNWFLVKFVTFQYGKLSKDCRPHQRIMEQFVSHGIDYTKGIDTLQEKKGTIKDKEEGGCGGNGELDFLLTELYRTFKRPTSVIRNYDEELLAADVSKRPQMRVELELLLRHRERDSKFFPRSVLTLLQKWDQTLDAARCWKPDPKDDPRGF